MKKTLALLTGLALAASALTASTPPAPGCIPAGGAGKDCPYYGQGQGQGQGQQKRHGWGQGQGQGQGQQKRWGQGQGQGQGKGFRGGPRDGSGPRRDGSCGQCPLGR